MTISILVALTIGLFALLWNAEMNPYSHGHSLIGNLIVVPLLAVVLSFGSNSLIQQLSCGRVQIILQATRLWMVPILFYVMEILIYFFPGLLWPIEGMFQNMEPTFQKGYSRGFYAFWMALYTQAFMNGLSQACPK
jgi:hypothetical protein